MMSEADTDQLIEEYKATWLIWCGEPLNVLRQGEWIFLSRTTTYCGNHSFSVSDLPIFLERLKSRVAQEQEVETT